MIVSETGNCTRWTTRLAQKGYAYPAVTSRVTLKTSAKIRRGYKFYIEPSVFPFPDTTDLSTGQKAYLSHNAGPSKRTPWPQRMVCIQWEGPQLPQNPLQHNPRFPSLERFPPTSPTVDTFENLSHSLHKIQANLLQWQPNPIPQKPWFKDCIFFKVIFSTLSKS